ncbi:MAG: hypoxanthine phosphoribosyltransferase [Clostridia bacterium]|nr:hypoxanthine phosphoribosyltransferase [Clostridia bacterium]MBQ8758489.1 hypoxanthine phosphoribosyltransferase [Clostridia bacterium]
MNYENDIAKVLVSEEEIAGAVKRIAKQMVEDYKDSDKKVLFLCTLKGAVVFLADLMKEFNLVAEIDFIKVSSYASGTESSGVISLKSGPDLTDLSDYNVVVIEDILDTGNTLSWLLDHVKNEMNAHSVKLCALFNKPDRRKKDVHIDYQGFIIPDEFIVGYGLDYNNLYRNLPYVGVLKPEVYNN